MTLTADYDPNNIFARMLRGEMACHRVFDDDVALAFMDIFPQSAGHTLVIPKVAARTLFDLPAAALGPFMERVRTVAVAVKTALEPDGVVITQFNGAPAGQTVFHLHVHIIPRYEAKPFARHGRAAPADADTLAALARRIAAAL